ncbi:CU044_5270 family protein [Nonomuraea zeae]|nr:CU044_5270 family protein [Nonomuraea zeae]
MGEYSQADLEALRQAWPQPAPPSPDAHAAARDALLRRAMAAAPPRAGRVRLPRTGRRAVTIGMLAAVISAIALVLDPAEVEAPRSIMPGMGVPAANAQAVLGRAAEVAGDRAFTAPRPDQWVYIETRVRGVGKAARGEVQTPRTPLETSVDRAWTRADGKEVALFEDGKLVRSPTGGGMPPVDYATVAALPTDPDALLAWMYANMGGLQDSEEDRHNWAYLLLGSLLAQNLVPPVQEAAVYGAMAKIPGVTVTPDAVDVDGRPAVAVARVEDGWVSHELLLDRSTYTYLGERAIASADYTAPEPGTHLEEGQKMINMGPSYTIKKGTIMTLAVRLNIGVTDRPGVRP